MYKRTNDVKEFAFWDLSMDWTAEIEKKKQKAESSSTASRFWPWKKSGSVAKKRQTRSASTSQLPNDDSEDAALLTDTNIPPPSDATTEPDSPDSEQPGSFQKQQRKVEVVPGVEVDLDDLEETKPTSNYTEWWESLLRAKERPDLLALPVNSRGDHSHLALTVAVSGVISNDKHFVDPWRKLPSMSCDRFAVVWESKLLKKVNDALFGLITSQVCSRRTSRCSDRPDVSAGGE